ncbi:MAG: SDR family oxidoreductase [Candidatus Hydrogenedentes bacterium]|nr:SDR family oxidoreductase [Candidatus Hydrogenedentota bacterium]
MLLDGKNAIVTGAGRGIGRAIAEAFAEQGCNIAALARSQGEIDETIESVWRLGRGGVAVSCDVARADSVIQAFREAEEKLGTIDILVNNAGLACFKPFAELSLADWEETMAVNLTGTFLCTQAVLPGMMKRRSGKIINISSVSGLKPIAEQSAYCAAKHGVNGLTKALALELQPHGIGVHAICPGGVVTRLSEEAMPERDKSGWMLPEDIAHTALFLATQHPRATTDIIHIRRFDSSPL